MSIEAQRRMHTLIDQFSLNPKLLRYLKEDKLYYSYRVAGWASIDSITYNPKYSKAVKDFEETTGNLVYHVVESRVLVPEEVILLTMLFVSPREENWPGETLCGDYIFAFVQNMSDADSSEYGDVYLDSESGALLRIA